MPTYKTPDVYVEEISVFPPSVAEVETAIPAFIGYTARAMQVSTDDLRNVPTRVKSLLEYETYFGGAPQISLSKVQLDDSNNFISATFTESYYLYNSIRSFFDNGGGPCYIVSVGSYSDTVEKGDFIDFGIPAIKKFDEPTILLFPDAAGLPAVDLGAVQQAALAQCAVLKDRVAVLDARKDDPLGVALRNNTGINNLKYGAAYTPWLKVSYNKNVSYSDISTHIYKGASLVGFNTLTADSGTLGVISKLNTAVADAALIKARISAFVSAEGATSINGKFSSLYTTYRGAETPANMQNLHGYVYKLASLVDDLLHVSTGVQGTDYRTLVTQTITNTLQPTYNGMIANEIELAAAYNAAVASSYTVQWSDNPDPSLGPWLNIFTTTPPSASVTPALTHPDVDTQSERGNVFLPIVASRFATISSTIDALVAAGNAYVSTHERTLQDVFPVYKNILQGINNSLSAIPPSGTMAGIYAMVDNQRGVWKAPANVSLANVVEPLRNFDLDETDGLNVDVNAGKSINAIRAFAGKGTLVWGARTLAGNDNEWRYISVRRFYNMVEESIKKSTYWAVFEPNDANTWVKVRGMIESYLTQKWREGALAGATPQESFFVRCGLGVTMTAQDILEGRMNVEIGMAVVRPAEFIVLKFSHMLQTS